MDRYAPGGVFNEFTFFSVLIPGLYYTTLILPLLPQDLYTNLNAWLILISIAFAFVVGVLSYVASRLLRKIFRFYSVKFLAHLLEREHLHETRKELLPKEWTSDEEESNQGTDEEESGDESFQKITWCSNIRWKFDSDKLKEEYRIKYQQLVHETWKGDSGIVPTVHSIELLCRNMMTIVLFVFISYIGFFCIPRKTGTDPIALNYISAETFGGIVAVILFITLLLAIYGYVQFTQLTVEYMLIEYADNN